MPIKKIKNAYKNRRKLTYKELEWDYLPMIVLFAVVAGILTLLFILLAIYQDVRGVEESNRLERFRRIENFLRREPEEETDNYYIEESELDEPNTEESETVDPENPDMTEPDSSVTE
ncbi:MAG TPA: hypothetical protein PKU78_02215 [Candidatus Dojkabacteria bacterium]|nr:hypothetical protein [Candidatus Dojkabacteria bacterium]HRO65011.1 hypothetical protein [Candidatus Dojkabacteria bacterium]HRP36504.1 hypothetical protein [Candidatus Dojkabacteria bacterium]HRP51094.1 hypothetical protein [Candidatus Dojkabacteria bacterium]